ncbi:DUF6763 family protein [Agaribacterium haliotis]|uniref:DUF6763 family protein n=1 Tax=Agaribacterium haliotis TaxID=2013869 RepID=UPI000BB53057|nr:DUF6763 family protein [Agaribacterium haliotis]
MASFFPLIGTWFRDAESGQRFEVVAIDEKQNTIEVQYTDGDIGEFDIESWGSMKLVETDAPEDAYGGMGGMENNSALGDGYGDSGSDAFLYSGYGSPLDAMEPENFSGFDDLF